MAALTLVIRRCNNTYRPPVSTEKKTSANSIVNTNKQVKFDRSGAHLFFTKHAKCRMKCRHITKQEVKDILINGTINYNKSDLNDASGPTYAVEGRTKDGQRVRIIFAPKKEQTTVVTVIDLEREYVCNCN